MPDLSKRRPAYRIALIGLMLSLALVLSLFESMLPACRFCRWGLNLDFRILLRCTASSFWGQGLRSLSRR